MRTAAAAALGERFDAGLPAGFPEEAAAGFLDEFASLVAIAKIMELRGDAALVAHTIAPSLRLYENRSQIRSYLVQPR